MNYYNYLDKLKTLLEASDTDDRFKVGAIVLNKNKIVAMKSNSYYKTHPIMKRLSESELHIEHKIYLHAEISAIIKARGVGDTLIIGRLLTNGKWTIAKPCLMCQQAIKESKIKYVYYTSQSGDLILLNNKLTNSE